MKIKRILAIALTIAMVLSVVPAFSLTVNASEFTDAQLVTMAQADGYVFDGSYSAGVVNGGGKNIVIQNITTPEQWTGWSSSWTSESETITNVNVMSNDGANNYIQVYGPVKSSIDDAATVTTSSAVQTGTKGKDFWILEFSVAGYGLERDFAIYDTDGDLIDAFRHLSGSIGAYYADNKGGAYTYNSGQLFTSLSYTPSNTGSWLSCGPYIRLVYENVEGGGYTASYYYSSDGSSYTLQTVKTFASGDANGFGSFKAVGVNGSGAWYSNAQLKNPKIYAGNYPEAVADVTVNFVDRSGNALQSAVTVSAAVGQAYTYSGAPAVIAGENNTAYYKLASDAVTTLANVSATASENVINITYNQIEFAQSNLPAVGAELIVGEKFYRVTDATNHIVNPSFETSDGNFSILGWHSASTGALLGDPYTKDHSYAITTDKYICNGGETAAENTIPVGNWALGGRWPDGESGLCSIRDNFYVGTGTFLLRFKFKTSMPANSDRPTQIKIGVSNSHTATTATTTVATYSATVANYPEWTYIDTVVTTDSSNQYVQFKAYDMGGGSLYAMYDDFALVAVEEFEPAASTVATYTDALNKLTVDAMTKGTTLSLAQTATDALNTTFDVVWTSSPSGIIAQDGTITAPEDFTKVTLTPTATLDGETATGTSHVVEVFPASYSVGDMVGTYRVDSKVDTSGISWHTRKSTADSVYEVTGLSEETVNGVKVTTFPGLGGAGSLGDSTVNARTSVEITPGKAYVLRFYYGGITFGEASGDMYNKIFTTAGEYEDEVAIDYVLGDASTSVGSTSTDWNLVEKTFTASDTANYLTFVYSWLAAGLKIADIELYEATDLACTVTLNITDANSNVLKTIYADGLEGNSVTFAAQSFAHNGVFYTTAEQSYTVSAAESVKTLVATADTTRIATTSNFSYNFNTGANQWPGDHGCNSSLMDGTIAIGWGDFRQTIMKFPAPEVAAGEMIGTMTLNVNVVYTNNADARYTVYVINPEAVGDGTMASQMKGYTWDARTDAINALGGVQVASQRVTLGANAITLDMSGVSQKITNEIALLVLSEDQAYTSSATTANPPYLNSEYTAITAIEYTVSYVDESGNAIKDAEIASFAPGTQYGYNNEVICPGLEIPAIDGYIFRSKSVSGETVTLTYRAVQSTDYFFDNIIDMNTRFVSLNMLGAHDAFTGKIDSSNVRFDAAGAKQGDEGSNAAAAFSSMTGTIVNSSKAQSLDTLALLEAGVRYFDIRLSRSDTNVTASYNTIFTGTAPHTNGVFYTTHGVLSEELQPILVTIKQWADAHPGEVIVLDFQEVWDSTNGRDGNGSGDSGTWTDINTLLTETGINSLVRVGKEALANVTYGTITDNGNSAGIVLFGRHGATNSSIGKFNTRGTGGTLNMDGRMYSYYDSDNIPSSYSASYIQKQVDYLYTYNTDFDTSGEHPIHWMFRVLQGQSGSSNILSQSSSDNTSLLAGLKSNPEWLTALPVVMVDGVGDNTDAIVTYLKQFNVPTVTVEYVSGGSVVKSDPNAAMVGTLYTNGGFYQTSVNRIVNNGSNKYYVTETFYTKPAEGTIQKVITGNTIQVDVSAFTGTVYTLQNGTIYSSNSDVGTANSNPSFAAYTWGQDNDRLGIAHLTNDAAKSVFKLSANVLRSEFNQSWRNVKFYAVSESDFNAIDIGSKSALVGLLTEDRLVATINPDNYAAGAVREIVFDAAKLKAAGENVVIIGNSQGGLYGMDGNTMEILGGYVVTLPDNTTVGVYEETEGITPTYTLPTTDASTVAYVVLDAGGSPTTTVYKPGASASIWADTQFRGYTAVQTGVNMVKGAQVRIGKGVTGTTDENDDGIGVDVLEGSGLRFIATVNYTETLAALGDIVEKGMRITAQDSSVVKHIPATAYQTADDTVFTVAITNIKANNYNRKYTAVPYVKIGDDYYYFEDAAVTRSIYQVAAGLLNKGYTADDNATGTEGDTTDYTEMPAVLVNVLNAYVNQTGIRLTLSDSTETGELSARLEGNGAYTGDAFFTVSDTTYDNGKYIVTLEVVGSNAEFKDYWNEFVRINNNNKDIAAYTTLDIADERRSAVLTFDYAKYLEEKAANSGTTE